MNSPRILLVASIDSQLPEMAGVARLLVEHGWDVSLLPEQVKASDRLLGELQGAEVRLVYGPDGPPAQRGGTQGGSGRDAGPAVASTVRKPIKLHPWLDAQIYYLKNFGRHWRERARREQWVAGLLADVRPDVVAFGEDTYAYGTPEIVRAAHLRGIPAVAVPYCVADRRDFALGAIDHPYQRSPLNSLVGRVYPAWTIRARGRRITRLPGWEVVAAEWRGLAPPAPWGLCSGRCDLILAESEYMRSYLLRDGLPEARIEVTGFPSLDVLSAGQRGSRASRRALYRELGIEGDRPLMLAAVPPPMVPGPHSDFDSPEALVDAFIGALVQVRHYQVVLRFHPALPATTCARLAERHGLPWTDRETPSLIPLAAVFVAAISATIRWALACGIPVVNFDGWRVGYTDFAGAPAVRTIESASGLRSELDLLEQVSGRRNREAAAQRDKERWGTLDGGAGARMIASLERLMASGPLLSRPARPHWLRRGAPPI